MKKIYFKHLERNLLYLVGVGLFSVIMITSGVLQIFFSDEVGELNKYTSFLSVIVSIGLLIFLWRTVPDFRHKYYVQWTKNDIALRINTKWGKHYAFKEINSVELNDNIIILKKGYNKEIHIDLNGFQESDINKLYDIILQHTEV